MKDLYFIPGPAELYFTVESHIKTALDQQIPSISHRSKDFEQIFKHSTDNLRKLLNIPDHFKIFFTGSATEIWERLLENCVEENSYHYVNGAFSKRFYQASVSLKKKAHKNQVEEGKCPEPKPEAIPEEVEMIACTQNETSTGVAQPLKDIYDISKAHPDKFIAVDAVSALPYINIDFNHVDSVLFSVQKGFGLPAGLGVWIVSERCIEKAYKMEEKGFNIGTYHSIPSLISKEKKNQTPETPNVLGIYLLGKVTEDMLNKGIDVIRQETEYKSAVLYNMINDHPLLTPFVREDQHRSKTVIVAETQVDSAEIIKELKKHNIILGGGYGNFKNDHIRIANFPTHSKEQIEMLADRLTNMKTLA